MKKLYLLIWIFLIAIAACKQETEKVNYKIPGSYKALEFFGWSRAYPANDIPNDGFAAAYEYAQKTIPKFNAMRGGDDRWKMMGPINTSGRTLTIEVNPQAERTIYAGSASGGLWRSRNLGLDSTWHRIETGFPVLGVSTIAFADQDSTVMFIGTGEVYNVDATGDDGAYRSTRGSYGIGILKSNDGGETWSKSLDWSYNQNHGVWMIKVDKNDPSLVYAATTEGVYKSTDQGGTWENVFENEIVTDIEIDPTNSDNVVASCGNFNTPNKGIFYTEDGGNTWSESVGVPDSFNGKILMARSDSNPNILYASVGNGFGFQDGYTWLLKSVDGGITWDIESENDYSQWQGWFAHDVAVSPEDPNEVITVGINIWKTTNGGSNLTQVSAGGVTLGGGSLNDPDGFANYSHSDHHFVKYHPTIKDLVLFGNDGGVFLSYDRGVTFRSANFGYQSTQFYNGFSVSRLNPDIALGGLQDNSTSILRGDSLWVREFGGDGSWTATSAFDENVLFASAQNLNIGRSDNGGNSFVGITDWEPDENPLFIAPYVVSQSEDGVMYAGGRYVYRSLNNGNSWETTNGGQQLNGDPVYALDVSLTDENVVYAGTAPQSNDPTVFVTFDGGDTWEDRSFNLPNRIINDINIHPTNPNIAIAVFSGFQTEHVFRTEDGGMSWQSIQANLPDLPTNAVIIDHNNPDHIYIGNDLGVFISTNNGESYDAYQTGLPTACIVMDLKISPIDNMLWVATHGNGTYRRPLLSTPVSAITEQPESLSAKIFPNPTEDIFNIELDDYIQEFEVIVYNGSGRKIIQEKNNTKISLSEFPSGTYIVSIRSEDKLMNQKIVKK